MVKQGLQIGVETFMVFKGRGYGETRITNWGRNLHGFQGKRLKGRITKKWGRNPQGFKRKGLKGKEY